MKSVFCLRHFLFVVAAGMLLPGCLLRRVSDSPRHFVLAPIPGDKLPSPPTRHLLIGISYVRMPSPLLRNSIAVSTGPNEIEYLENALWAERLDHCFERTLAANLSRLLVSDGIYLGDLGSEQILVRVSVNVQQFEVDTLGSGRLIAQWQITNPQSDTLLKSGLARLVRTGDAPKGKPEVIATTLSALASDFSRDLAQSIRESIQSVPASPSSAAVN